MTYRIAAAQISHETNVFSVVKTDLAAFARSGLVYGEAIVGREAGTNSAFGGFIEGAAANDLELLPIMSVWATPSGAVTGKAIERLIADLLNGLSAIAPIDGVLLGLHGAMVSEIDDDGDGLILESVRAAVGPSVPIVATLDLHANISQRMVDAATVLIGYDTYPHIDMAARAREAVDLMAKMLAGEIRPVTAMVKPPMAPTSQKMITDRDPMRSLIALAQEMERDPRVLNVTLSCGFPPSDVYDTGVSVLVTTDGDRELANELSAKLARKTWESRFEFVGGVTSFDEAAEVLRSIPAKPVKPTVVVDIGDNPWSGSPGDSAELVRFLLGLELTGAAIAMVVDRESVRRCIAAGVASWVDLELGGKTDELHGPPLALRGYVGLISDGRYVNFGPMMEGLPVDIGPTVVLQCGTGGGVQVLITSFAETPIDLNVFRAHGIEPTSQRIIGLKGKGHFRAAFEPIAERIVLVEGPGISGSDFTRLPFKRIRRPIWPLDEGVSFG